MNDRHPTDRDRPERERAGRRAAGRGRPDRCVALGLVFLAELDLLEEPAASLSTAVSSGAPRDPLSRPELARHRETCSQCAQEWAEIVEFETGLRARFEDPASIPAEVRASYVGAHRRAVSQFRANPPGALDANSAAEIDASTLRELDRETGFETRASESARLSPPSPGRFRFAAAILLAVTLGVLSSILGSGRDRPEGASLGLIRIERSGAGTLSPGEPFRLRATASREGYLTIVVSDGESVDLLFPHPDPTAEGGFSSLGASGFAIDAGESWEVPHPNFGEFTASLEPGLETYFLFTRPLSHGLAGETIEPLLREHFDASLDAATSLARFESWLRGRYASVDRVAFTVE